MIRRSTFESAANASVREIFYAGTPQLADDFVSEAEMLTADYIRAVKADGDPELLLLRFHLSDPANQQPLLLEILKRHNISGALSLVGQAPCNGARIALEAWHWDRKIKNYRAEFFHLEEQPKGDSYAQTAAEFEALGRRVAEFGGTVAGNAQRTWLYCRDIDNNYAGLVAARNEFFARHGLTVDTHFITSTGIGGEFCDTSRLVYMDTLIWQGLAPGQVDYLTAPQWLSPTALYGVSFERGSRILFGDRSHYYISGTASIDREGKVLHLNDVRSQTRRLCENIAALLESGGASLADLRQLTVYLRDPADADIVESAMAAAGISLEIPMVMVSGKVCRPTWLVEAEGIAINPTGDDRFPVLA